jgi:hypothetical protein
METYEKLKDDQTKVEEQPEIKYTKLIGANRIAERE